MEEKVLITKPKIEEKIKDLNLEYDYNNFREQNEKNMFKSMNELIKQNDYNEQQNTGPIAYNTSHTYHSSQYLNLNNSNDFTLGITETNLSVFSNSLEKIKEEDRIKELTKHIDN